MAIEGTRGRLREWMEGESMFGRTHPQPFRSGRDGLRGASERDDGQVASATDEGYQEFWRPRSRCCRVYWSLR